MLPKEQSEVREKVWTAHRESKGVTLTADETSDLWLSVLAGVKKESRLAEEVEALRQVAIKHGLEAASVGLVIVSANSSSFTVRDPMIDRDFIISRLALAPARYPEIIWESAAATLAGTGPRFVQPDPYDRL